MGEAPFQVLSPRQGRQNCSRCHQRAFSAIFRRLRETLQSKNWNTKLIFLDLPYEPSNAPWSEIIYFCARSDIELMELEKSSNNQLFERRRAQKIRNRCRARFTVQRYYSKSWIGSTSQILSISTNFSKTHRQTQQIHSWVCLELTERGKLLQSQLNSQILKYLHFSHSFTATCSAR